MWYNAECDEPVFNFPCICISFTKYMSYDKSMIKRKSYSVALEYLLVCENISDTTWRIHYSQKYLNPSCQFL